jgi:hypothetical protein
LDVIVSLDNAALSDLAWWVNEANFSESKGLLSSRPDVYLSSDACRTGWGAVCLDRRTSGPWTSSEPDMHINSLKLLAALKVLECFTSSVKDCSVVIEVDNTTAASYINKLGGFKSKALYAQSLFVLLIGAKRNLYLSAVFVPGILNTLADAESSRAPSSGDWMLSPRAFKSIQSIWEVQVDLFASEWNRQLPRFVSWFQNHKPRWFKTTSMESGRVQLQMERPGRILLPPFNFIHFVLSNC